MHPRSKVFALTRSHMWDVKTVGPRYKEKTFYLLDRMLFVIIQSKFSLSTVWLNISNFYSWNLVLIYSMFSSFTSVFSLDYEGPRLLIQYVTFSCYKKINVVP